MEFAQAVVRRIPTPTTVRRAQPKPGVLVASGETGRAPAKPSVVEPTPKKRSPLVARKLEKYITNSIGTKLVLIPAGKFSMGSPPTEKYRNDDEGPQHEVHITMPFYIGVYEVTQAQYQRAMGSNPSYFSSGGGGEDKVADMATRNFPVETVNWNDAVEFCKKLSNLPAERAAGRGYRLPSEAE